MNIKEVKKLVTSDIIFSLLVLLGVSICLLLSLMYIFAPINASAAASNINSYSHSTCNTSSMGNGSMYGAFTSGSCQNRSIGTTYSGQANTIGFWLNYNFQAGKYYTFTINFKDNDLLSSTIVDVVRVLHVPSSTEWTNTYNFISKKQFKVYFLAPTNSSSLAISLSSGSGDPITGVSNYGISSITIEDNDNSDEVINNATENTTNIINNNNSNTSDIINNQNSNQNQTNNWFSKVFDLLGNVCPNLFGNYKVFSNMQINSSGTYVSDINSTLYSIPVTPGNSYILQANTDRQWVYNFSVTGNACLNCSGTSRVVLGDPSTTFTVPNGYYFLMLRHYPSNNENNESQQVMLSLGSTRKDYCVYGSLIGGSKLDGIEGAVTNGLSNVDDSIKDLTDLQQQQTDFITDNSDPVVDSSGIQNTINSVQVTNPLSYLLTLPTNLLNAIITGFSGSNICRDFELGKFGVIGGVNLGTYTFRFPCINIREKIGDTLYNTIDIIVGIGFLVMTIVKLYGTISNYLTSSSAPKVK